MSAEAALSDRERRFDAARRKAGLALGSVAFAAVLLWPAAMPPAHQKLLAVLLLTVVFWISEALPLPVSSLLAPCLAVLLGIAKVGDAFAPFGDPVIFLFLGSFLVAEALHTHGLDRRMALGILSRPAASRSSGRVRVALGLVTAAISMWINNTATTAMMLPIALGLTGAVASGSRAAARGLLLTIAFAASIGGIATPVGTAPNLIALGFLDRLAGLRIGFLPFMLIGVPLSLAILASHLLLLRVLVPAGSLDPGLRDRVVEERRALPAWGAGQRACAVAFGFAVTLWLFPGVVVAIGLPEASGAARLAARLPESVVALLAAALLFAWPAGERRALTWTDAGRVDYGTLLLFGGGLSLGKLMFDTGLAESLGRTLLAWTGVHSLWGLTALSLAAAILLTEIMSNTAAVTLLAPLVLALARDLQVAPAPPLLAAMFGASMAFMLPISTPPNAIVYGTGLVPLPTMLRVGVLLDLASFFLIFAAVRLLCPLLGLA